jgi:ABC-type phosphate/phosphonate transport system permease subunit
MTPRSGLYVALVGLVMAVLCIATLGLLAIWDPPNPEVGDGLTRLWLGFIISVDLGAVLGVVVMVVGLVMAGVLALTRRGGKPS